MNLIIISNISLYLYSDQSLFIDFFSRNCAICKANTNLFFILTEICDLKYNFTKDPGLHFLVSGLFQAASDNLCHGLLLLMEVISPS